MVKKLSTLFAFLALALFVGAWVVHKEILGNPVMETNEFLFACAVVVLVFWVIGIVYSRLGVDLIQEIIKEAKSREEERRHRARKRYEQALGDENGEDAEGETGV
ncbi:MAG: hypothetical protein JXR97_11865 [Planctomycetes bacterium]|nr:hypothetical protein [Planctomycetota bacterium]